MNNKKDMQSGSKDADGKGDEVENNVTAVSGELISKGESSMENEKTVAKRRTSQGGKGRVLHKDDIKEKREDAGSGSKDDPFIKEQGAIRKKSEKESPGNTSELMEDKLDKESAVKHDVSDSETSINNTVSDDTLTLTSMLDLNGGVVKEAGNKVNELSESEQDGSSDALKVSTEAWLGIENNQSEPTMSNGGKNVGGNSGDGVQSNGAPMKRHSSPFFLKQLDITNEILKYDPNQSADIHVTSLESPPKKMSVTDTRKQRAFSLNSSTTNDEKSDSYSRSSSANDDATSNIQVAVRVRPLCSSENQRGDKHIIEYPGQGVIWVEIGLNQTKPFTFNTVFDEKCQQTTFFEECGIKDLVNKALDGFSCTAFAFGQTGSGKTHTITGPANQSAQEMLADDTLFGLVPRAFQYLFEIATKRSLIRYRIKATFLEVYNEKVKDLLNPSNAHDSLPVRWSSKKGFYVDNLYTAECESLEDLMDVLIEGSTYRQVGVHAMNDHSSRSHSMLTVHVCSEEEIEADDEAGFPMVKHGKISFVDLAGSERAKETKTTGEASTESNNINKSLLTLGNCISALGDPKKRGNHIPYRESKLTKLLAHSLGGDGFTLMIACISPSSHVLQDTMNTLRYANRAKNIKNKPVVKMDAKEQLLQRIKREIKLLRAENSYFRQQLGVPCSESQIILTPNQIEGELTPNESGTLSPAIGANTLSSVESSRDNSCKNLVKEDSLRASTALYALGAKNGLYDMLQEYMIENDSLKVENMQLHRSRAAAQRQQEDMFQENERLARKLDDLGRVMLSTPISREHVRTWLTATPNSDIFSRQTTNDRMSTGNDSARCKDNDFVRFPPVRQGSYPNVVSNADLSNEVEYEKQKLYEKREKEKVLVEKKMNGEHSLKEKDTTKSPKHIAKKNENSNHEGTNGEKVSVGEGSNQEESNTGPSIDPVSRQSNIKNKENKVKKLLPRPWRIKKKPTTVEKPSSYAAQFAARKGLLLKQNSQPSTITTHALQESEQLAVLEQQHLAQENDPSAMSFQQTAYAQMQQMYGYNAGYSLQYPYMGMVQTMHPNYSMNPYSGVNPIPPEPELMNSQNQGDTQQSRMQQNHKPKAKKKR